MKATGIISALIFAHAAFAQAIDSTSAALSSATGSASASAASSGTASSSAPLVSPSASASSSVSNTKSSTKSASSASSASAAVSATSSVDGASSGSPTSVALAATQSAVASSNGNPLVPDSASSTCTDFLNQLNADTAMSSCLTPLLTALSTFNPTSGSASASAVTKTLNNLCASNACSASTMRSKLTAYKDTCGAELTGSSPDAVVIQNYDILYSLTPLKAAICSKDANTQAYCLLNVGSSSSAGNTTQNLATGPSDSVKYAQDHLANALVASRRRAAQTVLVPNTDTYRNTNLMYLFTSPDMNSGELCTSCTQQIISKYVAFESSTPYALGLQNSPLLGGQSELWSAIQDKCPATFLTEVSNIAGVPTADQLASAASPALAGSMSTVLLGALAAFALI